MQPVTRTRDELLEIPGIGPSMARDLHDLGVHAVADLVSRDPEAMYAALSRLRGVRMDRCVLYVFRCAVHYSKTSAPRAEDLKWWNWTDDKLAARKPGGPCNG
jgi:nucleotidyltransferase/DNA polymerase involved in DNA repair